MTIYRKTILIVGISLIALITALGVTSSIIITDRFSLLEEEDAHRNMIRAKNQFSDMLSKLKSTVGDWAPWNDTYLFIQGKDPGYIENNLNDETIVNLGINFMLFLDRTGNLVYTKCVDLETGEEAPVREGLIDTVLSHRASVTVSGDQTGGSGILMLDSVPVFIASESILKSDSSGPSQGTLVVGKYLDASQKAMIEEQTQLSISVISYKDFVSTTKYTAILSQMNTGTNTVIQPQDNEILSCYFMENDIEGDPAFILEIISPRHIRQHGISMLQYFIAALIATGLFTLFLILSLLDRLILSRLGGMSTRVREIADEGDPSLRLEEQSPDEIGSLASMINSMLTSLETYHQERVKAEERYRAIVQDQTELICRCTPDGIVTFANDSFSRNLSRQGDELIGKHFSSFIMEDDRPLLRKSLTQNDGKDLDGFEVRVISPDDTEHWYHWNYSTIFEENGLPFELQLVGRDITDRKRAELALQENEDYLRSLFNSISCGVVVIDPEKHVICDINANALQQLNRERHDVVGHVCHDCICPAEKGRCPITDLEQTIDLSERILLNAAGETIPILKTVIPIVRNGKKYLIESFMNIEALKKAEEELRKREETYRRFFEQDLTGDFVVTPDGRIVDCNPAFLKIFGYDSIEEMKEVNAFSIFSDHSCSGTFADTIREKELLENLHLELKKRDGTTIHTIGNYIGMFGDDNNITEIRGYVYDDTERVMLEKEHRQRQKMEAIGTLAGGIAHDFNNILTAIIGYSEIVMNSLENNTSVQKDLDQVLRAAGRARDLVKQILTFSRGTEQELKPVQVNLVVQEALKLLRATLPMTIEMSQDIKSSSLIMADPTQIHQILMNLCTNARDAMIGKGGKLTVTLCDTISGHDFTCKYSQIKPGKYMMLSVKDTGCGMTPDTIERIFDPFFSTKDTSKGTGLGLSMVHGIVKGIGGTITVESEPDKGTTFSVFFPIIDDREISDHTIRTPISGGTERILFVDDEKIIAEMATRMIEHLGYEVSANTDSTEALEVFRSSPHMFDLVITDMTMPGMTGVDLAEELMKIREDIPIILCTGYSESVTEESAKDMGIRKFVMKPFVMERLATVIKEVLEGQDRSKSAA